MSTSSVNIMSSVLDVQGIVDNLIYVESAPVRRMQSQSATLQSKVSAFQSLNTKLSTLLDSVNGILFSGNVVPFQKSYTFSERLADSIFAKGNVESSDDSIISATATNVASTGNYSITVSTLAQAKSMASAGFADISTTQTGTGTLVITTGANDPITINVDSSNNTLTGLRNAINAANAGVTASILNDGSATPYRLLITASESGTANAFIMTENLSGGQVLSLTQTLAAADAQFVVNGVSMTNSSNTISDVISGVTFLLKNPSATAVTLAVGRDISSIISALKEFVSAYNDVNSFISSQFTYNATTKQAGLLSGDSTLRRIQTNLQNQLIQAVTNRFTSFSVANQIGIEFDRDGSLSLNETQLEAVLASDFTGVAALLLGDGTPASRITTSDSRVSYAGKTAATQPGTYHVQITNLAEQATVQGNQIITFLDAQETLTITSGGIEAMAVLHENDDLTTVLETINSSLSAQGIGATAMDDGNGRVKIATNSYGGSQSITVVSNRNGVAGSTGFDTSPTADTGSDIGGTIDGHAATGSGLTLTGAAGEAEEGLSLNIAQSITGDYGTVTIASETEGMEGSSILVNMQSLLDGITDPLSGPIHNATDSLNMSIRSLTDQISEYEDRLDVRREMLLLEFQKADEALRLLTVTQSSLSNQLSNLASIK